MGLYVAAHKRRFYEPSVKWYGKIYPGQGVSHDPDRVQGLTTLARPQSVGDLMRFIQAPSWMRLHLAHYAETIAPLQELLDKRLQGTAKRVAARKGLTNADWTEARLEAWEATLGLLEKAVRPSHVRSGWQVFMFPDASELFRGCCLTQVPRGEMNPRG